MRIRLLRRYTGRPCCVLLMRVAMKMKSPSKVKTYTYFITVWHEVAETERTVPSLNSES